MVGFPCGDAQRLRSKRNVCSYQSSLLEFQQLNLPSPRRQIPATREDERGVPPARVHPSRVNHPVINRAGSLEPALN